MGAIVLRTSVPGPNSQALLVRRQAAVPQGPFHVAPIFVAQAAGAAVTDVDGNVLLDFTGGLGCLNVGHGNPQVVSAVVGQAQRFLHTCFHVALYEPYVALAEKLNAITPGRFPKKTLLVNSGAEAVENAVKIARYHTKRPAVIGFEHGFAGRTLLAMSLTSKVMPYKFGFGPFAPEVYRMPYPYAYRDGGVGGTDDGRLEGWMAGRLEEDHDSGVSPARGAEPSTLPTFQSSISPSFIDRAIAQMLEFFHTHVDPRQVACVVMELVTGEGGFIVAPVRYVQALAAFCRANGILFVVDEIQTGFARTGRLFATEHFGIEPDLITTGKSLAGGMPLAAVTGRAEIMDSVHVGGLGGTYGGNPVACAAALATIEQITALDLVGRAQRIGATLQERLAGWQTRCPLVGDVRGLGAMMAIELVTDRRTREPAKEFTVGLVRRCYEHGVLVIPAGTHGNVLRFLVPLVITDEQLAEGLTVIEQQLLA